MRGNFINTIFEKDFEGIKVTIGEHCKVTINDFINLKEASDGKKHKENETDPTTKTTYQKYGHMSDLFDYMICRAFQHEYEIYQRGGKIVPMNYGKRISRNGF